MKKLIKTFLAQFQKLRLQLFLAFFSLLALFLVMMLLSLLVIRGIMTEQLGASRQDVLRQIAERASAIKMSSITLLHSYAYEVQMLNVLNGEPEELRQTEKAAYLTAQKYKYDKVFTGFTHEIILLGENGYRFSTCKNIDYDALYSQLWYRGLLQRLRAGDPVKPGEDVQFSRTFRASFFDNTQEYWLAAGTILQDGQSHKAVLLVLMDEKVLHDVYAPALGQGGEIYIYDSNGFIMSHSNKKMLGKQFIDVNNMHVLYGENSSTLVQKLGVDYLLSTYLDAQTGWTIVEEIPTSNIFGPLKKIYVILSVITGIGMLATLSTAAYVSLRVSRPLTELSNSMDAFGRHDFTPIPADTGTWEIDHLRESFNHMGMEIFRLMDAVQAREQQKSKLEMNFLRAQINPHFLYNMLISIRCTMEMGKNVQAAQMLEAFTDLLRSTLVVQDAEIPLDSEFESTRKYLVVQKLRYGENVQFEMDMDAQTAQCLVPPLILQPLVENAIFHGLEAKNGAGLVVVGSSLVDGDLLLTVTDDGAGMSEEKLAAALHKCHSMELGDGNSIGLSNVHNRILLNYGENYGVSIESAPDIGTTVTLRMPAVWPKGGL